MADCPALLDHRDDQVLTCALDADHEEEHFPGRWRMATEAELEAIRGEA